jgi:hypothetical protein
VIRNCFRAQKLLSSGVVEGLKNKAQVTMRKSYGFRTFRRLELALYHLLGELPEPDRPANSSDEAFFRTASSSAIRYSDSLRRTGRVRSTV